MGRLDEALSHKHMVAVAHEISQIPDEHHRNAVARHFERIFADANPRFDRYRFHQAAAGHPESGRDHQQSIRGHLTGGFTRRHFQQSAAVLKANPETRDAILGHVDRIHSIMNPNYQSDRFKQAAGMSEGVEPQLFEGCAADELIHLVLNGVPVIEALSGTKPPRGISFKAKFDGNRFRQALHDHPDVKSRKAEPSLQGKAKLTPTPTMQHPTSKSISFKAKFDDSQFSKAVKDVRGTAQD